MKHIKYPKIETLWKMDNKIHKYIKGNFVNKNVEYLKDCAWIATEKVDGQNIGIVWDGVSLSYQGRTENTNFAKWQKEYLDKLINDKDFEILVEQLFRDKKIVLYCEFYGYKIGAMGPKYSDKLELMLFDVYDIDRDFWYRVEPVVDIAKALGLDTLDYRIYKSIEELERELEIERFDIYSEHAKQCKIIKKEGYVCYPKVPLKDQQGKRISFKIKYKDYLKGKIISE